MSIGRTHIIYIYININILYHFVNVEKWEEFYRVVYMETCIIVVVVVVV